MIPAAFSLHKSPLCHTRSKALLISQNTTLTSLPESNASLKVLYRNVTWLVAESPGIWPDWYGVRILLTCK